MRKDHLQVLIRLYILGKKIQALIKRHNADVLYQGVILMFLAETPLSVSQLADQFGIKVSAMSSQINTMEKAGLLARMQSSDKRINTAKITKLGQTALTDFTSKMYLHCTDKTIDLSVNQTKTLLTLLARLKLEEL